MSPPLSHPAKPWQLHLRHPASLLPERHLERGDGEEWQVTGSEAAFRWQGRLPLPGWNMIEIAGERSVTGVAASLTFETPRGTTTVELPLRAGKVTKRLVRVPFDTRRIVFCPMNARGRFRLTHFRCVWLTPWFAHDRLLQRLTHSHRHYRGRTKHEVRRDLRARARQAKRAWTALAMEDYETTFVSLCSKHNYRQWIEQVEMPRRQDDRTEPAAVVERQDLPRISLLLPVTSDDPAELEARLATLSCQTHGRWQACVILATSLSPEARDAVARRVASEPRVQWIEATPDNGGAMLNAGLAACDGELVAVLTRGDRLSSDALHRLALAFGQRPELGLLYADEDRLDANGRRHTPNFKPGWNPDLLLSRAYLGHMACVARRTLEALGGFPAEPGQTDGQAMMHATALRFLATFGRNAGRRVTHLPWILLHRCSDDLVEADPRVVNRVQAYLDAEAPEARAHLGLLPGSVRVCWPIPRPAPLVSLLVPTRDGVEILRPCVDAILERTAYRHFELLILDNQSDCPETLAYMAEVEARDARVRVLRWNHPFNYSAINNFGASQARGELLGLVNNDIEPINSDWLTEMVGQAGRPEIGCVGAKLYYPNGTIQHGGVILGLGSIAGHGHRFFQRDEEGFQGRLKLTQNLSAVTAACLLLRRSVFEEVGGLNEADLAVAYNDVDLCLKVREAGYRNLWTPHAELYHHESVSRGADDTPKKRARWLAECDYMRRTWEEQLDNDPAYNPNLTLVHEDFSLR
ncbi:glycosyltransferase family 2 protein [Halomonas nitroreducens]|uniref:Glycosyltransferase n=1 Tax=Halomonas nitroreducens TaxID=447425 RepID=A0A3S0KRU9_9GAMM|nr:glycosyltransferase [Halomonas nitroreducens]RTR05131.1 glycosyltransferase [Halomonas nitroreducens]